MKKSTQVLSLFLVFLMLITFSPVIGLGSSPAAPEIVQFSEDFENGISGWIPYTDNKVSFTPEAGKAETNALQFHYSYDPSVSYNWDYFPLLTSPRYNASVGDATHLAFDFYLEADAAAAASGSMQISPILQSPQHSYWFMLQPQEIYYSTGTPCGNLRKFSVSVPLTDTNGNILEASDTTGNFVFVTAGVATNYSGNVYYDNLRLVSYTAAKVQISKVTVKNPYTLKPGVTTEFTCKASGGAAPYQYAFYLLKDGNVCWKSCVWTSESIVSFTPAEAGDYTLLTYCRDASRKRARYEMPLKVYAENEVATPDKVIALTFDDGPDNNAGELLDILAERDVKATFYVLNSYAQYNTALLQRTAAEGHQIGNHTYTHADLTQLTEAAAKEEITKNADFIQSVTGIYPKTYRPPYISYNNTILNYFPDQTAIGCSIDSRDWTGIGSAEIIQNVVSVARDGDIVLLHEPQANTRAAVGEIIDQLRAKGFEFVTVDELFRRQNVPMQGAAFYSRVDYQTPAVSDPLTASELISNFNLGWNLGNTLDSHGAWIEQSTQGLPSDYETAWKNPVTTKAMIDTVKSSGFPAIRIPVTWYQHLNNGTVDAAWMARVKEVVDYAVDNNLYVILNLHHEDTWITLDGSISYDTMAAHLTKLWTQIAEEFADYDQHLIFEVLNEPRSVGASDEWIGNETACRLLNRLNSTALKAIRATGGINLTRCVLLPTYAAGTSPLMLSCMEVPMDPYAAVSVHAYTPYQFCTSASSAYTAAVENELKQLFSNLADFKEKHNNIPMVLGEFGCYPKTNPADRTAWASDYLRSAKVLGIPCFLWDDGGSDSYGVFDRNTLTWSDAAYLDAMLKAVE